MAALSVARIVAINAIFVRAKTVAFYYPSDGEINPMPLLDTAVRMGKQCYLPCLAPNFNLPRRNQLWFARYTPGDRLMLNKFGIGEPVYGPPIVTQALDLILMPLVCFDPEGNRLGMGKGFYDATLAFVNRPNWHRPTLLGLAHEIQHSDELTHDPWDIPLHGVATNERIYWTGR